MHQAAEQAVGSMQQQELHATAEEDGTNPDQPQPAFKCYLLHIACLGPGKRRAHPALKQLLEDPKVGVVDAEGTILFQSENFEFLSKQVCPMLCRLTCSRLCLLRAVVSSVP